MRTGRSFAAYRAALAVDLLTEGASFTEIGQQLGYADRSGAWRAVQRAMRARVDDAVDRYRNTTIAEAEMVQERAWARAMAGDPHAAEVVLKAMELRLKAAGI